MKSKDGFLKNKDLANWWAIIAHDDRFATVCTYARAEIAERKIDTGNLIGAILFESVLTSLPDADEPSFEMPKPGMRHDIDQSYRKKESTEAPAPPVTPPEPKKA